MIPGGLIGSAIRYAAAIAIASGLGTVIALAYPIFSEIARGTGTMDPRTAFGVLLSGWLISAPFVAAGMTLIGLPTDYLLRRFGNGSPFPYLVVGTLAGLTFSASIAGGYVGSGLLAIVMSLYGAISALTYWALFPRRRRPAP